MNNKKWKTFIMSIEQKLFAQETKAGIRFIGSVLVALSGLILFSDKVINIQLSNTYGFKNTSTFIWVLSQSLSPFLMAIAIVFKPYKTAYVIPVYFYAIQLYWVFNPSIQFDNALLQTYAIGVCMGFILLGYTITKINRIKTRKEKLNNYYNKIYLSKREKEIAEMLHSGINDYNFISNSLVISYKTVTSHTSNIFKKANVTSKQEFIDLRGKLIR